jgi:hypothetical protein
MQYYTFELDEPSKDLCAICTPFDDYHYCRLPIEIKPVPDTAREIMESLFRHLNSVDCHIDDVGCFDRSWNDHTQTLEAVLTVLQNNNFTIAPIKYE